MASVSFMALLSPFGQLGLVWQETDAGPKVRRVVLPNEYASLQGVVQQEFPGARQGSCPAIAELGERLRSFLGGEDICFDLETVALDTCSQFQQRVLVAEHGIPRGWVSTYGRIARHLGVPRGARAVGMALARNPFPLLIPCHRAIRSNGELGGFQGGPGMKRALLELEGIEFSPTGKVLMSRVHY